MAASALRISWVPLSLIVAITRNGKIYLENGHGGKGAGVAGDVGGVLIPKSGLSARDTALLAEINAMWTGITMDHLSWLARNAAQNGTRMPPSRT